MTSVSPHAPSGERWQQFATNVEFCRRMVRSGKALEAVAAGGVHLGDVSQAAYSDLYRAAWVQAVAALDHWLHQEVVSRAIVLINDRTGERPKRLASYQLSFKTAEDMQKRSIDEVMIEHMTERLGRDSYQKPDRIAEGLGYLTDKKQGVIWSEVAQILGAPHSADTVKARQTEIADRRNKIAHEADIDPLMKDRRPISADETGTVVDWIADLAKALAKVMA
jgi:hypothetical protein